MNDVASEFTLTHPNWFMINVSELGFMGKLFKATDLPVMVTYFHMFYNSNPVDLMSYDIIVAKVCSSGMDANKCRKEKQN